MLNFTWLQRLIFIAFIPANLLYASDLVKSQVIELFTPEDLNFFEEAIVQLLDSAADGESISWNSPNSGANGTLELIGSYEKDLRRCREVKIVAIGKGYTDQYSWAYCRDENYQWSVDP